VKAVRTTALQRPAPYVFTFVLALRLVALLRLTGSASLLPTGGDMRFYHEWAERIAGGQLTDHSAFYGLPLYPYLLALIYRIAGEGVFIPAFLQCCLDAGTAVIIYNIGSRLSPVAGALGCIAWAFFEPAQAFAISLMPTAAAVFVFWFLVWQVVKSETLPRTRYCFLLGVLAGIAAMGVATELFALALLVGAVFWRWKSGSQAARISAAALILFGALVGTAPCWIHNTFIARDPVFLSAHSGVNFWIGNNPDATGYPHFTEGLRAGQSEMLQDSISIAETSAGRKLKRSEVSDYWSAKARTYIRGNFSAWAKLLLLKLRNFWSAFEYDDVGIIGSFREQRITFPGLHFGVLAALAIPGAILWLRRAELGWWIAAAVSLQILALLPVFVTERYRLAAAPGLVLFAAAGACLFFEQLTRLRWSAVAVYVVSLGAATLLVAAPPQNHSLWAVELYNAGRHALELGDLQHAEQKLGRAYAYVPDNSEVNLALGNLRLAEGNEGAAQQSYLRALELDRRNKGALNNLGVLALNHSRWTDAAKYFRAVIDLDPVNAKAHFGLAKALSGSGDVSGARAVIARAVALEPNQPEFGAFQAEIDDRHSP
jgi:cytochrome c-type biogenesis protein CcmH/NrfG